MPKGRGAASWCGAHLTALWAHASTSATFRPPSTYIITPDAKTLYQPLSQTQARRIMVCFLWFSCILSNLLFVCIFICFTILSFSNEYYSTLQRLWRMKMESSNSYRRKLYLKKNFITLLTNLGCHNYSLY